MQAAITLLLVAAYSRASVTDHYGSWSSPPMFCGPDSQLTRGNTDAPLLGNGDIGVNLCGDASHPVAT